MRRTWKYETQAPANSPSPVTRVVIRLSWASFATCLALTASAQAQPIGTLQPHSVRTLAHLNRPEPPLEGIFATPARPQDGCLGKTASQDAAIAACSALIQGGERWRHSQGPAYGRRAEAHRAQGSIDAALADFERAIKLEPKKAAN
jgi:tetratricopeptide repeat protein